MSKARRKTSGIFWVAAFIIGAVLWAKQGRHSEPQPVSREVVAADTREMGGAQDTAKGLSLTAMYLIPFIAVTLGTVKGARWAGIAIPQWTLTKLRRREQPEDDETNEPDTDLMGREDEMFLGYDAKTGEPVYAPRRLVASAAVGGESGAGKTSWALQLIMDRFEAGARVVVIDPDAKNAEFGLGSRLGPLTACLVGGKVAQSAEEIKAVLDIVERDFAAQQDGGEVFETLVVIDEWMMLLLNPELKKRLQRLIKQLAVQGRKWGLSVFLLAQDWKDGTSGMIRDMLVTRVLFRMARNQASLCAKRGGFVPVDTPGLEPGEFYWISADAPTGRRVRGINPTVDQVKALAARLAARTPVPALVGGAAPETLWDEADMVSLRVVTDDER